MRIPQPLFAVLASEPACSPAQTELLAWAHGRWTPAILAVPGRRSSPGFGQTLADLAREVTYPPNWRRPLPPSRPRWSQVRLPPTAGRQPALIVDLAGDPRAAAIASEMRVPLVQLQIDGTDWRRWGNQEVQDRAPGVEFRIVHRDPAGTESILKAGAFPTRWSPRATAAELARRAGRQVALILDDLEWHLANPVTERDTLQVQAPPRDAARRVLATLAEAVRLPVVERRRREANWHIAAVPGPWESAVLAAARPLPGPSTGWLADPHWCQWGGVAGVFAEQFDPERGRGHIAWMPWNDGTGGPVDEVIASDVHLSFPWTFQVGQRLFMTMESGQARCLRVYECQDYPLRWRFHSEVMRGVEAVDPIVVEGSDAWFLLVNIDSIDAGEPGNELHVFWADDPLSGDWRPVPGNPQVVDPECARNGGMLRDGADLLRVAQRHGYRTYGQACTVMRLLRLDRKGYREEPVREFDLGGGRGPHTLTGTSGQLIIDVQDVSGRPVGRHLRQGRRAVRITRPGGRVNTMRAWRRRLALIESFTWLNRSSMASRSWWRI